MSSHACTQRETGKRANTKMLVLRTSDPEATQRVAEQLELGPSASGELVGAQLRHPSSHTCSPSADSFPHGQEGPPSPPPQPLNSLAPAPCLVPLLRLSVPPGPGRCTPACAIATVSLAICHWPWPHGNLCLHSTRERPVGQTFLLMVPPCFKHSQHQLSTSLWLKSALHGQPLVLQPHWKAGSQEGASCTGHPHFLCPSPS